MRLGRREQQVSCKPARQTPRNQGPTRHVRGSWLLAASWKDEQMKKGSFGMAIWRSDIDKSKAIDEDCWLGESKSVDPTTIRACLENKCSQQNHTGSSLSSWTPASTIYPTRCCKVLGPWELDYQAGPVAAVIRPNEMDRFACKTRQDWEDHELLREKNASIYPTVLLPPRASPSYTWFPYF